MSKFELIRGAADIDKAIASIKARGAKLDEAIWITGLSVLAHASEHGDTTPADRLVNAMPKGGRKLALVEWMLAFGQVAHLDKGATDAIKAGRVFKLDRAKKLDLDAAELKPWYEFKKEAPVSTAFDAQKACHALLARIKGAAQSGLAIEGRATAIKELQEALAVLAGDTDPNTVDVQAREVRVMPALPPAEF